MDISNKDISNYDILGGAILSRNDSMMTEQLTDSAYYILLSLLVPRHGYAIMKYIEELTDGEITMGPATLYTLIKKLMKNEYIEAGESDDERRKPYIVTNKGRDIVLKEIERRSRMVKQGIQAIEESKEEKKYD
ncbi:lineage-specific thermal regulator protein [compost metagenome]